MELRICLQCQDLVPQGLLRCPQCQGAIGIADAWSLIGRQLGRYRLTELIGAGGMGLVYAAQHTGLQRRVAIKLLLPGLQGAEFLERFRREARLLAELRHPNIVEIYDFDVTPAGVPYYAMELLEGDSLATLLQRAPGPRTLPAIAAGLRQMGAALQHANRCQVVHRDLKPDNIFLARIDGELRIKLLDFGIAKKLPLHGVETNLTRSGAMMGTPLYLTPEQIIGGVIDARADQYALALIVSECLLGYPLRQGLSLTEIIYRAEHHPIAPAQLPDSLPSAARNALVRATEPNPAQRYESVQAFIDALELPQAEAQDWGQTPVRVTPQINKPVNLLATTPALRATEKLPKPDVRAINPVRKRVLLGTIVVLFALFWANKDSDQAHKQTHALRENARWATPADAGALIGVSADGALLQTAGGVYLRPLADGRDSTRRANAAGESILGVTETGDWLIRRGDQVFAVDPKGTGEQLRAELPKTASALAWRRDGRAFVFADGDDIRLIEKVSTSRSLAKVAAERLSELRLGEQTLLVLLQQPLAVQVHPLDGGASWSISSAVGKAHSLAWDEATEQIAICGFAPQVEVHKRDALPQNISVANACYAALWLPGGRQLLLRNHQQLVLWSDQSTQQQLLDLPAGGVGTKLPRLVFNQGAVLLSEPASNVLLRFELSGSLSAPSMENGAEIWDLLNLNGTQYVAHSDGVLSRIAFGKNSQHRLHDAGITDLIGAGETLASASDDRTLAVWRTADMSITWRTRGHEFLVNQLWLAADASALWSSSSDGSLKQWRWPALEIIESIDVRTVLNDPKLSLHAVWFNPQQNEALIGTWNHALIHLQRQDGDWQAQRFELASHGGYRLLDKNELDAVILLGISPTRLWVWDKREKRLASLPDFGLRLFALSAGSAPERFLFAGEGALLEFQLRRDADGRLSTVWRTALRSQLGTIGAADVDESAQQWWLGNNRGQVRAFAFQDMPPFEQKWRRLEY